MDRRPSRFRAATAQDVDAILRMMATFYAEDGYPFSEQEARAQLHLFLRRPELGALWVASVDDDVAGYLVVALDFSFEYGGRVAFIDELFLDAPFRGAGLGREAMALAERYCGDVGVRAIHLEVEPHRTTAAGLYEKAGFRATGRTLMTKRLARQDAARGAGAADLYGRQLAQLHHEHFSGLAREAAAHLLRLFEGTRGRAPGRAVVELACGGGVSSKLLVDAGCEVIGVDVSEAMLELARAHAPGVTFVRASLWDYQLPSAVDAITAIGEAFCYHSAGSAPTRAALEARLRDAFAALTSGGVLLFDVATPGRSGPTGARRASWNHDGAMVFLEETEDPSTGTLERIVDTFTTAGELHRHQRERHRLTLYDAGQVAEALARIGFRCRQVTEVGAFALLPGWVAFEAIKP
ncbi:MAG: GNAT family N-acetyltransferase [Kofleriaceae bacterium]